VTGKNKGVLPIKWKNGASNYNMSRFEVPEPVDSRVRIPPDRVNESENKDRKMIMGREGFEPPPPRVLVYLIISHQYHVFVLHYGCHNSK
jgi:hypothetical protein